MGQCWTVCGNARLCLIIANGSFKGAGRFSILFGLTCRAPVNRLLPCYVINIEIMWFKGQTVPTGILKYIIHFFLDCNAKDHEWKLEGNSETVVRALTRREKQPHIFVLYYYN